MCERLMLGVLPPEKEAAYLRGEPITIEPHEASRFMLLMDERKDIKVRDLEGKLALTRALARQIVDTFCHESAPGEGIPGVRSCWVPSRTIQAWRAALEGPDAS